LTVTDGAGHVPGTLEILPDQQEHEAEE